MTNQDRMGRAMLNRTKFDSNEILISGNIAEVVLYDKNCKERARAIIDVEDIEKVKKHKWCVDAGYAKTNIMGQQVGMQHIIMGTRLLIDHKDRNKLNNRKTNYRYCTQAENTRNKSKQKNNTSGLKGVYKSGKKWTARIKAKQKEIYLGTFKNKVAAAKAYNIAAIRHFGSFACLNEL